MNIRPYEPTDITKLYADIRGLKHQGVFFGDEHKVHESLWAAYLANRAAAVMSYGDSMVLGRFPASEKVNTSSDPGKVHRAVGLLLAGSLSNDGRDFLPEQDRAVLEDVRAEIGEHFIELAARRPGRFVKKGGDSHDQG